MADSQVGAAGSSGYAHAVRDSTYRTVIMQLKRVPDPAVRSAFVKQDGDVQVPSELLLVVRNGMR